MEKNANEDSQELRIVFDNEKEKVFLNKDSGSIGRFYFWPMSCPVSEKCLHMLSIVSWGFHKLPRIQTRLRIKRYFDGAMQVAGFVGNSQRPPALLASFILTSGLPVIGMPMAVHDCGDDRDFAFNRVDECVGKTARPAFAMVFGDFSPRQRMTQNTLDGALDFV